MAFTDDFNRANASTLGSPWVDLLGPFGISSNQAGVTTSGPSLSVVPGGANDIIRVTVSHLDTGGSDSGLVFRAADDTHHWRFTISSSAVKLTKVNGSSTDVWSDTWAGADGDELEVDLSDGASIKVSANATLLHTETDSFNDTEDQHGLYDASGFPLFDDFSLTSPPAANTGGMFFSC